MAHSVDFCFATTVYLCKYVDILAGLILLSIAYTLAVVLTLLTFSLVLFYDDETLAYVLSSNKFAVILSFGVSFLLCRVRYFGDGDCDLRRFLHDGRAIIWTGLLPILVAISSGVTKCGPRKELGWTIFGLSDTDHLTADILKMVSRSITCQLELNTSSTTAF